jgi:uncharacterized protein (DUF362 family)
VETCAAMKYSTTPNRREFLTTATGSAAAVAAFGHAAAAHAGEGERSWAATPPAGFTPFNSPGLVVGVEKHDCMQPNKLYPKADDAKAMLTRVMTELTGAPDLVAAVGLLVHPSEVVCVKVNGIAEAPKFATNKELVLPFLEALVASGVKPENITVLEQFSTYLMNTRIHDRNVPAGVKVAVHGNQDTLMPARRIAGYANTTKFARVVTDASAVINFALVKHHSICGFTGAMKNMTHGTCMNPSKFHEHKASPQIALLYGQDVIRSRVRLNIADAFNLMAHGGPLGKTPEYHRTHESVYASTDPVAIDRVGWDLIDKLRADFKLRSLSDIGLEPAYIQAAADLGLGIADLARIRLRKVTL